jgi:fused signal recognition particle receptor
MSNQSSNPISQYSGLNAPLIFPEAKPVVPAQDAPVDVAPSIVAPSTVMPASLDKSVAVNATVTAAEDDSGGFFGRMKLGLAKTRRGFTDGVVNLLIGGKEIDDELLEEIETQLLVADCKKSDRAYTTP